MSAHQQINSHTGGSMKLEEKSAVTKGYHEAVEELARTTT
jgi:hypothetical protein